MTRRTYIEEWRAIAEYDGLYEVSDWGRVKSVRRVVPHSTSVTKTIPEKIKNIQKDSQGYCLVSLWKDGKEGKRLVHRLVAKAFIPNPENLPEVNHRYGIKEDNRPSELNWSTASDNQKHSYEVLKRKGASTGKFGADNAHSIKVKCLNFDITFPSVKEAAKVLGVCASAISVVCTGKRVHTEGLNFKYI